MKKSKNKKLKSKKKFVFSTTQSALLILGDIAKGQIEAFFPHPYYHTFCNHENCNHKNYDTLQKSLSRLEKKGLIQKAKTRNKIEYSLSKKGKEKSKSLKIIMRLANIFINPKKHTWDGKWRAIIFDIPERLRPYRDELRGHLEMLNFFQLQKSVWIHPLPIPKEFFYKFIRPSLRKYIRIAVIESLDREDEIRKHFFNE